MSLEEFKELNFGKPGEKNRDEPKSDYENFKIEALIHDTRVELRMAQG